MNNRMSVTKTILLGIIAIVLLFGLARTLGRSIDQSAGLPGSAEPVGITVTGYAKSMATPDIAHISLGVVTRDKSAVQASSESARVTNAVIASVKQQGISEKDIQTAVFSTEPRSPSNWVSTVRQSIS